MVTATTIKKGYKQTELGIIPEDWEVRRLDLIANIHRGASPRPIDDPKWFDENSEIGWVRISDVTKSNKYLFQTTQNLSSEGINASRFVGKNSLIMSICATVGRPIITKKEICIHDGFVVFEQLQADIEYVFYYLASIENKWSRHGQTGSQMNLNTELIGNEKILLPKSKSEQTAIATVLSDSDTLIECLKKLIAKKKNIKRGAMQQLLTGKKRLPGFKEEWCSKTLGEISEFYKGKGLPKSQLVEYGKYRCIHYGELFTRYDEEIKKIHSFTDNIEDVFFSKSNDVLMPTSDVTPNGLATASCIKINDVILGGDILIIRTHEHSANGVFLSYCISLDKNQIMQLISGTTVFHLYGSDMRRFKLKLPSLEEQNAIVQVLSDMNSELEELEQKRDKYAMLKQGMMQQLLTGRIRIYANN